MCGKGCYKRKTSASVCRSGLSASSLCVCRWLCRHLTGQNEPIEGKDVGTELDSGLEENQPGVGGSSLQTVGSKHWFSVSPEPGVSPVTLWECKFTGASLTYRVRISAGRAQKTVLTAVQKIPTDREVWEPEVRKSQLGQLWRNSVSQSSVGRHRLRHLVQDWRTLSEATAHSWRGEEVETFDWQKLYRILEPRQTRWC